MFTVQSLVSFCKEPVLIASTPSPITAIQFSAPPSFLLMYQNRKHCALKLLLFKSQNYLLFKSLFDIPTKKKLLSIKVKIYYLNLKIGLPFFITFLLLTFLSYTYIQRKKC